MTTTTTKPAKAKPHPVRSGALALSEALRSLNADDTMTLRKFLNMSHDIMLDDLYRSLDVLAKRFA